MEDYESDYDDELSESEIQEYIKKYKVYLSEDYTEDLPTPDSEILESIIFFLIEEEAIDEAMKFCKLWLRHEPESASAWYALSILYSGYGDYDAADQCIDKASELDPSDSDIIVQKALNYSLAGNNTLAIMVIDKILEKEPENDMALYNKAFLLQSIYRYNDAIKILEQLLELESDEYPLFDDIAYCYQAIKKYDKALHYYKLAIEDNPDDVFLWYNLGIVHNAAGHKFQAIEALKNSISIYEDLPKAHFALGSIYAELGRLMQAIDAYSAAFELEPNNYEHIVNLATALADSGDYHLAIMLFTFMIDQNGDSAIPFFARSLCYDALEDYENASADIKKALHLDPSNPEYLHSYATILINSGNDKKAIEIFKKCIKLAPENLQAKSDFATLYIRLGDMVKARKILKSIIEIEPKWTDAYHLLAKSYIAEMDFDSAAKYLFDLMQVDIAFREKIKKENPEFYEELERKTAILNPKNKKQSRSKKDK